MKYILLLLATSFFYLCLIGCKTSVPAPETVKVPESFSVSGKNEPPQRWWTAFNDPELNKAIDSALRNNFTIKAAWQRLAEARAIYKRQSSDLSPDLDLFAGASDRRGGDLGNKDRSEYEIGLAAAYEIDLWGRIKSLRDAEEFRIKAGYAELQTAALSIAAEICRTWFQLIEAGEQIKILRMQIETNNKSLQLLTNRFKAGQIRQADVLRQKQLVESDYERIIVLESRAETLLHLLAVLQGTAPQHFQNTSENSTLPKLPEIPATGVPLDLLKRRPDVKRAHNLIYAANKELAAAIAERYPRLSLSASFSSLSGDPVKLFGDWFRSFSAVMLKPVADGGEREAEIELSKATEKLRVNEYGETVLRALQEVEDALIQEQKQIQRIESLEIQQNLAKQTYDLLEAEYFNGAGNFLDMLESTIDEQDLRRDILTAKLNLLEFRIELYRALAGGLDMEENL